MTTDLHLRALFDVEAFAEEQRCLGRVWTMLGIASDLPTENDWFRTLLGGCSVFIQRLGGELRGFENRCAHRSYPLRTADRGNGPILCGFHHWRYDADGLAVGIPNCQDAFGATPREFGKSLTRLDVASCGDLIFARFPGETETLEEFLGAGFEALALLCADLRGAGRAELSCQANWRLMHWINLEEYHLAAVHPGSFGAKAGYLRSHALNYVKCGPNSVYFLGANTGSVADWTAILRAGARDPVAYRVFNLMTGTIFVLPPPVQILGENFRYVLVLRNIPAAHDRCEMEIRFFRLGPNGSGRGLLARIFALAAPLSRWWVRRSIPGILREDGAICEALQEQARQITPDPPLGAAEERIGWFNRAYADAMRCDGASP
jgi:phenylpropionate dioxygenase-like ring-hydroxylating dioxygenase large terminal subunit